MIIDREKYPHLSQEDLLAFVNNLKEMELKALVEAIELHGEALVASAFNQVRNEKIEDELVDIDDSVKEIRKLLSGIKTKKKT